MDGAKEIWEEWVNEGIMIMDGTEEERDCEQLEMMWAE